MLVTVTGGQGHPPIGLQYDDNANAIMNAQALAAVIDDSFTKAIYDSPKHPVHGSDKGGYLIAKEAAIQAGPIDALGFDAVVLQNLTAATVIGGGDVNLQQTVLAGNGGLTYRAATGNATVVAGGGRNQIDFGSGNDVFISTDGSNRVVLGSGHDTVEAGTGFNTITLGSGTASVVSTGTDKIKLGSGTETINASGSAHVLGAASVSASGYTLTFIGGAASDTVDGGAGSYSITAGAGGGKFTGGSGGDNSILGGAGNVTLIGGGAGDTLAGGSGTNIIQAGLGNETLIAGAGATEFTFADGKSGGAGSLETVQNFNGATDVLNLAGYGPNAVAYALDHSTVSGGSTTFSLEDGTKVKLVGFTHLSGGNFT